MLEGVLIPLRCARRQFRRASGIGRSSSPVTGTGSRGVSALGIVVPGAYPSAWGCSFDFIANPPPGLDVADDGLAALVDVDVLDRDLLLALAAVAVEAFDQRLTSLTVSR